MSRLTLVVALLVAAPAFAGPERAAGVGRFNDNGILLLPLRVEVLEVAPGGATLLKPDWTENATTYAQTALDSVLGHNRAALVKYATPADGEQADRHAQVIKVHALVRDAIILHRYRDGFALPSKGRFEWSLGPGASVLREDRTATRYALFVELSERRLSPHFFRVGSLGNEFSATASIVDLGSGDVLWFNYERGGSVGTAADTLDTVKRLLRDLPL